MSVACVRLEFGPNVLEFDTADDAIAFAQEQGCEAVTYWPIWFTRPAHLGL